MPFGSRVWMSVKGSWPKASTKDLFKGEPLASIIFTICHCFAVLVVLRNFNFLLYIVKEVRQLPAFKEHNRSAERLRSMPTMKQAVQGEAILTVRTKRLHTAMPQISGFGYSGRRSRCAQALAARSRCLLCFQLSAAMGTILRMLCFQI